MVRASMEFVIARDCVRRMTGKTWRTAVGPSRGEPTLQRMRMHRFVLVAAGAAVGFSVSSVVVYLALTHAILPTQKERIANASSAGKGRIRIAVIVMIVVVTVFGGLIGLALPARS
jgi:hypothetical protein